eukprot:363702-Chlamydomonas_euryale.AAC.9
MRGMRTGRREECPNRWCHPLADNRHMPTIEVLAGHRGGLTSVSVRIAGSGHTRDVPVLSAARQSHWRHGQIVNAAVRMLLASQSHRGCTAVCSSRHYMSHSQGLQAPRRGLIIIVGRTVPSNITGQCQQPRPHVHAARLSLALGPISVQIA